MQRDPIKNPKVGDKWERLHGSVFNCSVKEFPARSQVFKFVGNINE